MKYKVLYRVGRSRIFCVFMFLVLFKVGGRRVSTRFHFFVPDVNQGNEEVV